MVVVVGLGVVPGSVLLPWPRTVMLDSPYQNADMIANVWQSHPTVTFMVHEADWRSMPLAAAHIDAAVGDGLSSTLPALA